MIQIQIARVGRFGGCTETRQVVDKLVEATGGLVFPIEEKPKLRRRSAMSCARIACLVLRPLERSFGEVRRLLGQGRRKPRQIEVDATTELIRTLFFVHFCQLESPSIFNWWGKNRAPRSKHKVQNPQDDVIFFFASRSQITPQ